jgi:putative oxygen-independent coproporphyrinogen III oxidase
VPGTVPLGQPPPEDGSLPPQVVEGAHDRDLGVYIHVPFCTVRCGYCDFNTYTQADMPGVTLGEYHRLAITEMAWAADVMNRAGLPKRPVSTVFFGGGTPSVLAPEVIIETVEAVRSRWGLAADAEVTVEVNPDSVNLDRLADLVAGGVTRFSVGMQSARPDVLAVLDRTHDPARVPDVVAALKSTSAQVSVDVIYGSPGESVEMWQETLDQVVSLGVDHVSAYSLIVEPGTALARRISRGELADIDEDLHAPMYELADDVFHAHGMSWYEVSNWSTSVDTRSRHNYGYWTSEDWWGIGPGAHSHMGGVRWWNAKHPSAWAKRLASGHNPSVGREVLDLATRQTEDVLLRIRTRDGVAIADCPSGTDTTIANFIARGLVDGHQALSGRLVLTLSGRLVADYVARELLA